MHLAPTGSRPRVLHVTQPVDGGVARVVTDLTRAQLAAGLDVAVACPDGHLADRLHALGADVHHWPATRSPGPALVPEVRRLARVAGAVRPDLVHAHSAKAGLAARLAVRGRIPTVFQPHAWSFEAVGGPAGALALYWERWGARWAARTVCVSEAERWRGVRAGVRGRWTVIPNGIDTNRFPTGGTPEDPTDPDGVRFRHGIGPDAPLVVCVGRLCRQKGQDVLLAAWRTVLARVPDARLVLVGDGPDRGPLTARASAYGFLDGARTSVVFAGGVDDVAAWYRAADLVVLPSRWEGMALAPLEAMACGRPVVVTDVDGAREGLPPALEPHCLVPPEEPATLAGAVAALLLDAPLRASLGRRGHAHVRSAHDVRHTAAAVAAVYGALLGGARTTGTHVADDCGTAGADLPLPHDDPAAPDPTLPQDDPATADPPLRRGGPSDAPRLLPDDRSTAMGRPAVVPIECRESTHP